MHIVLISAAALTLAAPTVSATAQSQAITIEHRDLNLSTPQGQAILDRRIQTASRKVCGLGEANTGTRISSSEARKCYREAMVQAHQQVAAAVERQARGG